MFELVQVGNSTFYIDCPAKIGVFLRADGDTFLIDSGFDKEAGKKIHKVLKKNSWRLKAIIATHSHADHIGGNAYLQAQTGCKVYAKGMETTFVRHPMLEPSFLFAGYPIAELRHKFFLAQPSDVLDYCDAGFPAELEVIPLPGHTFDMAGIRTPDDVVFLSDCVSGASTLEKYGVPFLYDVGAFFDTLDRVEKMQASLFVPAHAAAAEKIAPLVRLNRDRVLEIGDKLLSICETPLNFEVILQNIFNAFQLKMSIDQYALVGSTIKSYLSYLKEQGKVTVSFKDNMLLWGRTS